MRCLAVFVFLIAPAANASSNSLSGLTQNPQVIASEAFINNETGLTNPVKTIDFTEIVLGNNSELTTQYHTEGVTFSGTTYNPVPGQTYPNIAPPNFGNFQAGVRATNPFSIRFNAPQNRAAFAFVSETGSTTFTALLNGAVVATASDVPTGNTNNNTTNFYGFQNITFDEIRMSVTSSNRACLIDQLQFDTVAQATGTTTTWLGGNGLWSDASKWSGGVPTSANYNVTVDNTPGTNSTVTLAGGGFPGSVGRLRIDAGDRVQTEGNSTLYITPGAFSGAGELFLNGALAMPGQELAGDKVINGTGKLMLGGVVGENARVTGATTNNGTIEGSGQMGGYYNSTRFRTVNNGTINANVAGQELVLYGLHDVDRSTNSGILKASNGGILLLGQGQWFGSPTSSIIADGPGSRLLFRDSVLVEGGNLSAINGGLLQPGGFNNFRTDTIWKDLTVSGPTEVRKGTLVLDGTITNNGVITVPDDAGIVDIPAGTGQPITLRSAVGAPPGQVVLDKVPSNDNIAFLDQAAGRPTKLLIENQLIRGRGFIGYESYPYPSGVELTNRGTFQADRNGELLRMFIGKIDNQDGGMLRAQDGGILRLQISDILRNTGGTIEALSLGRVEAGFARIDGGVIRNFGGFIQLGGMTLVNTGTGMRLEGDITLGIPGANQGAVIVNEIQNTGILRIAPSTHVAHLRVGEAPSRSASLTGGGQVILGDAANGSTEAGIFEESQNQFVHTLTNVDNTIRGFGRIGDPYYDRWLVVNNTGVISADVPEKTLSIELRGVDNTGGMLRAANGGRLRVWSINGLDNVGGTMEATQANSSLSFGWFTNVTGGLLRNTGGTFDLSHATLRNPGSGVTLQGPFIINNNREARFVGEITNEGSVTAMHQSDGTRLIIGEAGQPNVIMKGGGDLVVSGSVAGQEYGRILEGVAGATLTLENQTLRGGGLVGYTHGSDRQLHIVNNKAIDADVNGHVLQLSIVHLQNNAGSITRATNGGNLLLDSNTIANAGANIVATSGSAVTFEANGNFRRISGGVVHAASGGTVNVHEGIRAEGGVVFNNAGTTVFGHPFAERYFNGEENGGGVFLNSGTVRKIGNGEYWLLAPLTHSGLMNTEAGVLRLRGGGTIAGGAFNVASGAYSGFHGPQPYTFSAASSLTGSGTHFSDGASLVLADTATQINATRFGFYGSSTLSGAGGMNISTQLGLEPNSITTFSGTKVTTLPGSNSYMHTQGRTLTLASGARLENGGTFSLQGSSNAIDGDSGTSFTNTGTLRSLTYNEVRVPFTNSGTVEAVGNRLWWKNGATFANGSMDVTSAAEAMWTGGQLKLEGLNTISGAGNSYVDSAAVVFAQGAKLNASLFTFLGNSSVSGAGELNIATDLRFVGSGFNTTINATPIRLAEAGTGRLEIPGGTLRFDNNALLELAGTFDVMGSNLTIATDGTGELSVPATGKMVFHTSATFPLELTLKGDITVHDGRTATFNAGGLFDTAKLSLSGPGANITFTGAAPWTTTGTAVEFNGTGLVNFVDTTLHFDDRDPGTTGDDSTITAGARIAFQGTNLINGAGELSSTGFVFQNGSKTTVDRVALKSTFGTADISVWNGNGGSLEFKNEGRFLNAGRFVIQSQVGTPLAPGIKGDAGTLFFNTSTGRVVHDSNTQTDFDIDFQNEGVLEFSRGTINFLKKFSGAGGIAASNGAKVNLALADLPKGLLPTLLETTGSGSEINVSLANGQSLSLTIDLNGGRMVAAGGLNMVAAGGLNMVAAGGGNIVAAGGMNMVAAGGGNITATGANSLISANQMVAAGGGNVLSHNGGLMVAAGGLNIEGGQVSANAGTIRSEGSAPIVAAGGGNVLSDNGGLMVAAGGGNMVAAGGGNMVAAGGGNMVAAGGGNMVAAGGGNMVAAGGGNMVAAGGGNFAPRVSSRSIQTASKTTAYVLLTPGDIFAAAGADDLVAFVNALDTNPESGMLFVDVGGVAEARDGGSIIAESQGVIAGGGTFTGPGLIKNGGKLLPGRSVGAITWNGALAVQVGGRVEIEIGGTSSFDRIVNTGSVTVDGTLAVKFLNNFGNSVQPTDTFDIITSNTAVSGSFVTAGRVMVEGTNGSFAVAAVNDGRTLRLTDFASTPPTFSSWATQFGLSGSNALLTADPDRDGISNLLEYALGLDPNTQNARATTVGSVTTNGVEYLTLSFTRPSGADLPSDILYTPRRSISLASSWSTENLVTHSIVPGPGELETVTIRSAVPMDTMAREFLQLQVTLQAESAEE